MAEDHIELTGDASSLVNAVGRTAQAFLKLEQASSRVQSDLVKFDGTGQAVERSILAIDAAGNKLATTFRRTEEGIMRSITAQKLSVESLKQVAVSATSVAKAKELLQRADELESQAARSAIVASDAEIISLKARAAAALEAVAATDALIAAETNQGRLPLRQRKRDTKAAEAAALQAEIAKREVLLAPTVSPRVADLRAAAAATLQGGALEQAAVEIRASAERKIQAERIAAIKREATLEAKNLAIIAKEEQALAARRLANEKRVGDARIREAALIAKEEQALAAKRLATETRAGDARIREAALIAKEEASIASKRLANEKRAGDARIREAALIAKEEQALAAKRLATEIRIREERVREVDLAIKREEALAARRLANEKRVGDARIREAALIAKEEASIASKRLANEKRVGDARIREAALIAKEEQALAAKRLAAIERVHALRAKEQAATAKAAVREVAAAERIAAIKAQGAAAERVPTVTRAGVSFAGATTPQVAGFVNAEKAIIRLAATGKASFEQIEAAILAARAGTISLTTATNQAEHAAVRLVAAQKQLGAATKEAAASTRTLSDSVVSLGRLIGISLLIGGAFRLVSALTEATEKAAEFSIKIQQIETITKSDAFATEEWAEGLRALSNEFGLDVINQAQGAYQVLSSQIRNASGAAVQGAEALRFLATANELAVAGVTDTSAATNLLTGAMNSFRIPAEEARDVAAKLFKAVELGRFKVEELGDGFGKVAVPANQLGISLSELLGVQAEITNQGVKLNEANTLIRGILLKLIKPTEAMKKVFRDLGAANAEALVAARGLPGALQAIEKQTNGTTTEIAELFSRVRAITGALAVFGENAEATAKKIQEIRDTTAESFGADTQRIIQSAGQQLKIAGQIATNFFEKEFGTPFIEGLVKIIKELGGMGKILQETVETSKVLGKTLFVAFGFARIAQFTVSVQAAYVAMRIAAREAALLGTANKAASLTNPIGIGVIVAITATELAMQAYVRSVNLAKRAVEESNLAQLKSNQDAQAKIGSLQRKAQEIAELRIKAVTRTQLLAISETLAATFKASDKLADKRKDLDKEITKLSNKFTSSIAKDFSTLEKQAEDATKLVKDSVKEIQDIVDEASQQQLDVALSFAGAGQSRKILEAEIIKAREAVNKAAEAGDLKLFESERKRLDALSKQRVANEVDFTRERTRLEREATESEATLRTSSSFTQKQVAKQALESIQRQQRLLETGNRQELKGEQELQKARQAVAEARGPEQFKAAVDNLNIQQHEQQRLNDLVKTELSLQLELFNEKERLAKQAERLREVATAKEEKRQKDLLKREAAQSVFDTLREQQKEFKREDVFKLEDEKGKADPAAIKAAVEEQLLLLEKLKTTATELGSQQFAKLFDKEQAQLLLETENKLEEIRLAAETARRKEINDSFELAIQNGRKLSELEEIRVKKQQEALTSFSKAVDEATKGLDLQEAGAQLGRAFKLSFGGFQRGPVREEAQKAFAQELQGLSEQTKSLQGSIDAFRLEPNVDQIRAIKELSEQINSAIVPLAERGVGSQPLFEALTGFKQEDLTQQQKNLITASASLAKATQELQTNILAAGRNRQAEGLIREFEALAKSTPAPKDEKETVKTATEALIAARNLIKEAKDLNRNPQKPTRLSRPEQVSIGDLLQGESLQEKVTDELVSGINDAKPAMAEAGKEAGEAAAAGVKTGLDVLRQQIIQRGKELESKRLAFVDAQRRESQIKSEVDTSIRLGQGAPSIREQEERISRELAAEAERLAPARAEEKRLQEELRIQAAQAAFRSSQSAIPSAAADASASFRDLPPAFGLREGLTTRTQPFGTGQFRLTNPETQNPVFQLGDNFFELTVDGKVLGGAIARVAIQKTQREITQGVTTMTNRRTQ